VRGFSRGLFFGALSLFCTPAMDVVDIALSLVVRVWILRWRGLLYTNSP